MYQEARERYAAWGVDTDAAIARLKEIPVSIHCWQGDDVTGLENAGEALSGGIQTTGNYPGKARTFEELTADFDKACSLIPGKKRLNLHASYAVMTDTNRADRDELRPEHFRPWVDYAKKRGLGLDFNPTFFSHPMVKNGLTLSSPDENVRRFWIRHGIACRRIAAYFAKKLNTHCLCNVWIPDGLKDVPADRLSPRLRLKNSLDQIFAEKLPGVIDSVESKVFGIGLEAYTVGSNEFYTAYAARQPGVYNLLDNGHYHPQEFVSDKIPAMLCYFDKLPLHITRPMRWDSDHVVRFEDEIREIATEIVPVSSETMTTTASETSLMPMPARWRVPRSLLILWFSVSGKTQPAAAMRSLRMMTAPSWSDALVKNRLRSSSEETQASTTVPLF